MGKLKCGSAQLNLFIFLSFIFCLGLAFSDLYLGVHILEHHHAVHHPFLYSCLRLHKDLPCFSSFIKESWDTESILKNDGQCSQKEKDEYNAFPAFCRLLPLLGPSQCFCHHPENNKHNNGRSFRY